MNKAFAKIIRLQKQERFLEDQEKEMVCWGLTILDKLDAAKAAEKADLACYKAFASLLAKASTFLGNLNINSEAFSGLSDSF